jgi:hypothetical protein
MSEGVHEGLRAAFAGHAVVVAEQAGERDREVDAEEPIGGIDGPVVVREASQKEGGVGSDHTDVVVAVEAVATA